MRCIICCFEHCNYLTKPSFHIDNHINTIRKQIIISHSITFQEIIHNRIRFSRSKRLNLSRIIEQSSNMRIVHTMFCQKFSQAILLSHLPCTGIRLRNGINIYIIFRNQCQVNIRQCNIYLFTKIEVNSINHRVTFALRLNLNRNLISSIFN